jgi:hypothetical protein
VFGQAGDVDLFARHIKAAKEAGLGVTLHIAEVSLVAVHI